MSGEIERAAVALHDRFTHGGMDRRAFMAELTRIAGGAAAATALLTGIASHAEAAPLVPEEDDRLAVQMQTFRWDDRSIAGYQVIRRDLQQQFSRRLSQPPILLVIHENRGLNAHIRDVARRFALEGYRVFAPDFLSLDGGSTPADEDSARAAIAALEMPRAVETGAALIRMLHEPQRIVRPFERHPNPVGIVGFCWGGAMVNRLAVAAGDALGAGVVFYGPAPDPREASRVVAPLLIHLAERDARVNATALPWVSALRAAGKEVRAVNYHGVDHAFHNDTSEARYDRQAARRAWQATLEFFRAHLRDPSAA